MSSDSPFLERNMPTFASSKANIAYLDDSSQPLGGLNQGMGYDPEIDPSTVTQGSFIGGSDNATIKYHAGAQAVKDDPVEVPVKKAVKK